MEFPSQFVNAPRFFELSHSQFQYFLCLFCSTISFVTVPVLPAYLGSHPALRRNIRRAILPVKLAILFELCP